MCSTEDLRGASEVPEKDDYYYKGGKLLASPSLGEEVVISG